MADNHIVGGSPSSSVSSSAPSIAENVNTVFLVGPISLQQAIDEILNNMESPVIAMCSGYSGHLLDVYNRYLHPPGHASLELPFDQVIAQREEEAQQLANNRAQDLVKRVIPARATRLNNGHFELTDICEKCEDISLGDSEICPHHQSQHTQMKTTESQHSNCEGVGKNVVTQRKAKKVVRVGNRRRMIGCRVRYSKALRIGKKIILSASCENGNTRVVWQPGPEQA